MNVFWALFLVANGLTSQSRVLTGRVPVSEVKSITVVGDRTTVLTDKGVGIFETKSLYVSGKLLNGRTLNACDGSYVPVDCWLDSWEYEIVEINGVPTRCRVEYYECTNGFEYTVTCPL